MRIKTFSFKLRKDKHVEKSLQQNYWKTTNAQNFSFFANKIVQFFRDRFYKIETKIEKQFWLKIYPHCPYLSNYFHFENVGCWGMNVVVVMNRSFFPNGLWQSCSHSLGNGNNGNWRRSTKKGERWHGNQNFIFKIQK